MLTNRSPAPFFEMKAFEIREKPYRRRGRKRLRLGKLVGPGQPLAHGRARETTKIPLGAQERTESVPLAGVPLHKNAKNRVSKSVRLAERSHERLKNPMTTQKKKHFDFYTRPRDLFLNTFLDGFSQRKNLSNTGEEEKAKCCILLKRHAERGLFGDKLATRRTKPRFTCRGRRFPTPSQRRVNREIRASVTTRHVFWPPHPRTVALSLPISLPNPDFVDDKSTRKRPPGGRSVGCSRQNCLTDKLTRNFWLIAPLSYFCSRKRKSRA
jgi:hypothetical protein